MTLRLRIAIGTAALAALAAGLHLLVGYLSFAQLIQEDIDRDLEVWSRAVASGIVIQHGLPVLQGDDWSWADAGHTIGFRVSRNSRIYLEGGVLPPDDAPDWAWTERDLGDGFVLELAFYIGDYQRALLGQLHAGMISLPLVVLLASVLGWWLAGRIAGPIVQLSEAADALSSMRFPDPVRPPPGDDELSRLAKSFNRMVFAVRDALERERAFTRYASHELRTPLATLQAQMEALEAGLVDQEKALPESRKALERMRGILEGLLTLSREPQVTLEPLPGGATVRQLVAALPEERARRVRLELPREEVWIMGDEELLRRALGNLVDNALKHSEGEVEVRLSEEDGEAVFEVRDYGDGVDDAQLARLADPFVRFNAKVEGTGLGLSLARQAAQAMRGRLEFEHGRPGLRALLCLPLVEDDDA
ncbi:sensor histidine kinase [Oceanithermus sp.]